MEFDKYGAYTRSGGHPARTLPELSCVGEWASLRGTVAEIAARRDWFIHLNDAASLVEAKITAEKVLAARS